MKLPSLVLFAAAAAAGASAFAAEGPAVDAYASDLHPPCWVQLCIADPSQYPQSSYDVEIFRFSLFHGMSHDVTGFDLGLVGCASGTFRGLAVQAVNRVEGEALGMQVGALFNAVGGNAYGLQVGGVVNCNSALFAGAQIASVVNFNATFAGFQLAAVNWNKTLGQGLKVGFANVDENEFHGWAIGAVNCADSMYGLQIGAVNVITKIGRGVQIGVFNAADLYSGLQIGALNLIGNATLPVLPVVNANF